MRIPAKPQWCLLLLLCLSWTGGLLAQDRIEESRRRIVYGGKAVQLGQQAKKLQQLLGKPTQVVARTLWTYPGMRLEFDRNQLLRAIELRAPFKGLSERRWGLGTPAAGIQRIDSSLTGTADGWQRGRHLYIHFTGGRADILRLGQAPRGWKPPAPRQPPGKVPAVTPATGSRKTKKPSPKPSPGPTLKPTRRANAPSPNLPANPGARVSPGQNDTRKDYLLVWDLTWHGKQNNRWQKVPVAAWPKDRGILLVRVTFDQRVQELEQLFCGWDRAPTKARDYLYRPDIVEKRRKSGTPLRWQWRIRGRGRARVKIMWFKSKEHAKRFARRNPWNAFAFPGRVPRPQPTAWKKDVQLIWEHTWNARGDLRFVRGPKEQWPDDRGVLLIRAFGGPGVSSFLYRAGLLDPVELPLGDHTLSPAILDRARKSIVFGSLFGSSRKRFQFAARGHGPVKVMLYWIPDARYAEPWCREFPRRKLDPWAAGPQGSPFSWLFQGPGGWRRQSQFQGDWNRPLPAPRNLVNVAGRASGSWLRRSSRDRGLSRGSEFDGGIWYSAPERWAFTESRFGGHAHLQRLDIGTAGSDFTAARYILVELEREDGTWDRIATFHNENINWYSLSEGRHGISRPSVSIPVDPQVSYRAVRLIFAGHGPFRAAGLRALGTFHGDRRFDDPPDLPEPARIVPIAASGGWTRTEGQVLSGRPVIIDVEGTWSMEPQDDGALGWSGPEGIAALTLRHLFSSAARFSDFQNSLPAPDLPAGSLIARVGLRGRPVLVTPGRPLVFSETGPLFLGINDAACQDNRGTLTCTVLGAFFPRRGPIHVKPDLVEVRCTGTIVARSINRPVPDVDVLLQLETWPRRVLGGLRTDGQGRFEFTVLVPRNQSVIISVPEFKKESQPRVWSEGGEFRFDLDL